MTAAQFSRPIVSALSARLACGGDVTPAMSAAADLVVKVHDSREAAGFLTGLDRAGLESVALVLAAMVPDDRPVGELLEWLAPPLPPVTAEQAAENRRALANALVGESFDVDEKRCGRCKAVKLVTEFHRDSSRHDGLRYACKPCHAQDCADRRAREVAA